MTNTKTTYKTAVQYAIANLPANAPADVREKLEALIVSLDKKSGAERKPTATQIANQGLTAAIKAFMDENGGKYTVSDLIKQVPAVAGLSNQKVSALVRNAEGIFKVEDKRKSYFTTDPAAAPADEG